MSQCCSFGLSSSAGRSSHCKYYQVLVVISLTAIAPSLWALEVLVWTISSKTFVPAPFFTKCGSLTKLAVSTGITGWTPQCPCDSGSHFSRHRSYPAISMIIHGPPILELCGFRQTERILKYSECSRSLPSITIFPCLLAWEILIVEWRMIFFILMFLNILAFDFSYLYINIYLYLYVYTYTYIINFSEFLLLMAKMKATFMLDQNLKPKCGACT